MLAHDRALPWPPCLCSLRKSSCTYTCLAELLFHYHKPLSSFTIVRGAMQLLRYPFALLIARFACGPTGLPLFARAGVCGCSATCVLTELRGWCCGRLARRLAAYLI